MKVEKSFHNGYAKKEEFSMFQRLYLEGVTLLDRILDQLPDVCSTGPAPPPDKSYVTKILRQMTTIEC